MLDLSTLNPQQREAVITIHGPVLILAGAGTGKTRVITCRIAHLIQQGVPPDRILAVTFTNKAAREMAERVGQLIPKPRRGADTPPARPTISTFHSLGVRILREHIEALGYKHNFVIYDDTEQLSVVKRILARVASSDEKFDPRDVLAQLSKLRNAGPGGAVTADSGSAEVLAWHIRSRYESALRACNAVDFDDLLLLTLKLLREHPDVLEACRARYQYVMVDEYQDTNAAQFELVHLLTCEHRNLCVVGDDDQSIYGWRGAEIANLLDLEKHFPEVKVVKLEQNYRSTTTILSAANAVIKNNARRRVKSLWSKQGQGTPILLQTCENDDEEARSMTDQIECDRMARKIPWGDRAVLFRTNQQSRALETALRHASVRYRLIGGQSFFDRREVRDVIAYLKMLVNPHDDVSLLRIANVPARGLSDLTMERLLTASQQRRTSVYAAMRHTDVQESFSTKTREAIAEFLGFIDRYQAPLNQPQPLLLSEWAGRFIAETGYMDELRRSEKTAEAADNRLRNLKELITSLDDGKGAAADSRAGLQLFLEQLSLDQDRKKDEEEIHDAVTLITMHSCKGLEFPHVHIVGLEEGLLPHTRSLEEGTVDEERRLFYVAITRARLTLRISHCLARKKYGQTSPCHPSRFLAELPADLVERGDAQSRAPVGKGSGKSFFAAMREAAGLGDTPPPKT